MNWRLAECHRAPSSGSFFRSFPSLPGVAVAAIALLCLPRANAQFPVTPQNPVVADSTVLRPPNGSRVAIVEFADLECPSCAQQNPILIKAAEQYHVPWIRRDFPLHQHVWSFQAAVNARWFDATSPKIDDAYRDLVFANQNSIASLDDLRQFTSKFAADRHIPLPFVMDPQNKLAAAVRADYNLGVRLGVHETPTIWIVTNLHPSSGLPYIHVDNPSHLYTDLDEAESATANETAKVSNHSHKQ